MTNQRDEMAALAKAAEEMGDEPPVIETPKVEEPTVETEPAQENLSGGLDGGEVEEPADQRIDLDDVLGITPKDTPVEQSAPVEEEPAPEPSAEQQRISELSERLRVAEDQNARFTEQALNRQEPQEQQQAEPEPEIDGEVSDYLKPHIEQYLRNAGISPEQINQQLAPMREQTENVQLADAIAKRVPGFKPEHMETVRDAYSKLPEGSQDRAVYGTGEAGATLLAQDLVSRGALDVGQKKQNKTSPLAKRHHSEAGATQVEDDGGDDMAKAKRIFDMPDDQFRAEILDRIEG